MNAKAPLLVGSLITAAVLTMTYLVMPRLAHWTHHWLRG